MTSPYHDRVSHSSGWLDGPGLEKLTILEQLKFDHENVSQLLDILDAQLNRIHSLESADFDLVQDIMHYMIHYPDRLHHPLEDLVIERLIERDPSARKIATTIQKEHKGLATKGLAFYEIASGVADGAMVLREELEAKGRDYVEFLRSHMRMEEEELFPRAEKVLSREDWESVAQAIAQQADPVFGAIVDAQYQELYAYIQQQTA